MKKLYFTILTSIMALGVEAQTLTLANNGPQNGVNYGYYQCDSLSVSAGPNSCTANWNFNSLVTHSSVVFNYTVATGSYTGWPNSNILASSPSPSADISYYSYGASDLKYWGGYLQLGGVQAELKFSTPATFVKYDASCNTGTSAPIAGSVVALSNAGTFTGVCTSSVAATGTMALPGRTLTDVVRITQNISISFTIGAFPPGTAQRTMYEFYSPSASLYPILAINQSTIQSFAGTSTQNYVLVQKNYPILGLGSNAQNTPFEMRVFPNPASDVLHFEASQSGARNLNIYDVTGKQLESILMSENSISISTAKYNNGLYLFKITDGQNRAIKSGRFTVVH